jgi:hypothetical protein
MTLELLGQDADLAEEIRSGIANGVVRCLITQPKLRPDHPLNNEDTRIEFLRQLGKLCSKSCKKLLASSNDSSGTGIVYLAIFDSATSAKSSNDVLSTASLAINALSFHLDLSKKESYIIGQFTTGTALLWRDLNPREANAFWDSDHHGREPHEMNQTQDHVGATGQMIYENQAVTGLSLTLDDEEQEDYEPPDIDVIGAINGNDIVSPQTNHQKVADLTLDEQVLQKRYFGLDQDDIPRCLCCGEGGHTINACPAKLCKSCGKDDHFTSACQMIERCTKCQSIGHSTSTCPERLKRSIQADGITCSLCTEAGHSEEYCPTIWTTFHPDPVDSSPVRTLQPMCYQCGANKHWGDDCPMRDRRATYVSKSFSMNYVSLVSPGYTLPPPSGPAIIDISSDEDYVPFLHDRQAPTHPQGITMNISLNPSSNHTGLSSRADHYSPPPPDQPSRRVQGNSYRPPPSVHGRNFDRPTTTRHSLPGTNNQPPTGSGRYNFQPPLPDEPPPPFLVSSRSMNRRPAPRGRGRGQAVRGNRYSA